MIFNFGKDINPHSRKMRKWVISHGNNCHRLLGLDQNWILITQNLKKVLIKKNIILS